MKEFFAFGIFCRSGGKQCFFSNNARESKKSRAPRFSSWVTNPMCSHCLQGPWKPCMGAKERSTNHQGRKFCQEAAPPALLLTRDPPRVDGLCSQRPSWAGNLPPRQRAVQLHPSQFQPCKHFACPQHIHPPQEAFDWHSGTAPSEQSNKL